MLLKKANFVNFLKLTITSQQSTGDKVSKLFQIFNDRNGKLVEYLAELLLKNYLTALRVVMAFSLGIESLEPQEFISNIKIMISKAEEVSHVGLKSSDYSVLLKKMIGISKEFDNSRDSIFK